MKVEPRITALVPTYNEEKNLPDCLKSVEWADEILVVDSFSTDGTLDIAREFGARIIQHEYINSATQKNWAIPQASFPWVLVVDADERVTPELRDEILSTVRAGTTHAGFAIGRLNHFLGFPLRHGGWSPKEDTNVRLFLRDKGRYQKRHVHADVEVDGTVGRLKGYFVHYSYQSLDEYFKKMDRYTKWAAKDILARGTRVRWHHLTLRPLGDFFRLYLLKGGFLDGFPGLLIALLSAYYVMVKFSRAWEESLKE